MTDEQINAAIAEAIDADPHWKCAKDYCNDLNAMHEAERVLTQNSNWRISEYEARLFSSVGEMNNLSSSRNVRLCFHTTARQRAEAFLRTLGKWKDKA